MPDTQKTIGNGNYTQNYIIWIFYSPIKISLVTQCMRELHIILPEKDNIRGTSHVDDVRICKGCTKNYRISFDKEIGFTYHDTKIGT